jgi:hypothetical protein
VVLAHGQRTADGRIVWGGMGAPVAPSNAAGRTLAGLITGSSPSSCVFRRSTIALHHGKASRSAWLGVNAMMTRMRVTEKIKQLTS